jgi:hypothetical protein
MAAGAAAPVPGPQPGAGASHGANLLTNPTLDLTETTERQAQLKDWLQQIALDAGLSGMETLLTDPRDHAEP